MELQKKEQELVVKTIEADSLTELSARQELDLTRKQAQISRYQNTRNMLIAIALISILLLLLFYNRYALKKKSGEVLARSNAELKLTLERLRETQDQLIHSEKMAGLGKLTAGIAHEIQNPLNFVRNFSESGIELFDEYRKSTNEAERAALITEIQDTLGRIKNHANRADAIVKSMLQHSRAGGAVMEAVEINNLLQDSVQLAFHSMRATSPDFRCRIVESLETIPDVQLLPQQIGRVILNLSNNAFYAMYEQMQQGKTAYEPLLKISTRMNNDIVYIILEDNGPGITPDNLQRIFEPFYTTKPSGKGTGLGLSISYDVVRQHGGDLQVESEPGKGAKFTISLPIKQSPEISAW
jgi:signal transduction histidine kinase